MRKLPLMGACLLAAMMASTAALSQTAQTPLMLTFTQPVTPKAVKPAAWTTETRDGPQATAEGWPAAWAAWMIGTMGSKCPGPPAKENRMRISCCSGDS